MKKKILNLVILLLVLVFAFSAWKAWEIVSEYIKGAKVYSDMDVYVSIPEPLLQPTTTEPEEEPPAETEPEEEPPAETEPEAPLFPEVDFEALWEQNPDVIGWIYIPDTKVNYPILQGKNNNQYLRHLITGEYNTAGSIFLEAGIPKDFSSQNNPIYGHRMRNGTMFADIAKYKTQAYYEAHPIAYLMTPEKNYVVRIFSGYVISVWGDAWDTSFSQAGFQEWLAAVSGQSCFSSDVVPTADDCILTFSTCDKNSDNTRFVVHAVLEGYPI